LTGVEFAVCVSNLTSNLPLYFSHKWTPDFRVQEAVGASMTIPPAIKPLYNESEVYKRGADKSIRIKVWGGDNREQFLHTFVDNQGNFSTVDYHRYEHIVKKALQKIMVEKNVWISTNNVTDISTFLPLLRDLVVGEYDEITRRFRRPEHGEYTVEVEGITYSFGNELFHFYYNAAYFGLLVDGGYRCNIPYNIFRQTNLETTAELRQVLAIKLDGGFPSLLISRLMSELSGLAPMDEVLKVLYKSEKMMDMNSIPPHLKPLANVLIEALDDLLGEHFGEPDDISLDKTAILKRAQFVKRAKLVFVNFYKGKVDQGLLNEFDKDDAAMKKLIISLMKEYRKKLQNKPWEIRKGISVPMAEGYAYGSELGQLRFMSDHNYIIPLYSCGIGTYDFDLDKVKTLVKLSQEVSEKAIEDYFK
jgi:predicted acylesterase/phospholipase RssA